MTRKTVKILDKLFICVSIGISLGLVAYFLGVILSTSLFIDISNFPSILLSEEVTFSIKLSVFTATIATLLSLLVGIPVAYVLSRWEFPGKAVIDTILDIPMVMPPVALGAALLIFFSTPLGMALQKRFITFVFEPAGLVLAQFTVVSVLSIRFMKVAFDEVDPRYEVAARSLGCSRVEAFFRVTLPLAKRGILAAILMSWARAMGEFGASITLAGASRMRTETLAIAIFLSLSVADIEKTVAIIFILLGISTAVLLIVRKITGKIFV